VAQFIELIVPLKSKLSSAALVVGDHALAKRTTLRVGGNADVYVEPAGEDDLSTTLRFAGDHQVPVTLLGRGSNLLIRDGGIRGIVVCLAHNAFSQLVVDGLEIRCGAGAKLKLVAVTARRSGLAELEFLEGIPGSIGGALRMNAGAMGAWMFNVVKSIRVMNRHGIAQDLLVSQVPTEYRKCPLLVDHIAIGAVLQGKRDSPEEIQSRMNRYSKKRWESQPAQPSAGCIFKNPETIPAGKLIDELGLKGLRVGAAMVSDIHGNFIVNQGSATSADVLQLIADIQKKVREARGIELETEVEILGQD
jgi:UDP-N-acetylenolpyruvoylglucosamine reductase